MSYLTEAFKQMELLESEQFSFDKDGAAKLGNFLDDDMLSDFEAIIDPEAETKEELKDSYMGNVICRCPICRSLIYRDPEAIVIDEKEQLANLEEPCPYCFEHGGFEIVGQVAPYEEVTVEGADEGTKVEVDGQEIDIDSETKEDREEILDESLNEGTIYDKLVKAFPELACEVSSDIRARRHTRDNEDIEDSQRFPVEGTKQRNLVERRCAKRRHTRDNENLEDSQRYPIKSPVGTKGLKESIDPEIDKISKHLASKVISKYPSAKVKPTEKAQIIVFFDDPTKEDEIKQFAITTLEKDLGYKANNVKIQYQSNNNKIFGVILGDISDEFVSNRDKLKESVTMKKADDLFAVMIDGKQVYVGTEQECKNFANELSKSVAAQYHKVEVVKGAEVPVVAKAKRHAKDNEDLEDSQRYPIESPAPAQTGLREDYEDNDWVFPTTIKTNIGEVEVEDWDFSWADDGEVVIFIRNPEVELTLSSEDIGGEDGFLPISYQHFVDNESDITEVYLDAKTQEFILKEIEKIQQQYEDEVDESLNEDSQRYPIESPAQTGLREGMEDISITTDDQVIKVKATPRADKETIQPVEDETKDVIEAPEMEEETPIEDMPIEDQDVEIEEFDEESFDNLGESYLRQVYENVSGFKTSDVQSTTNKIIVEGIISFNSGKKAKTKFIFEAKDATKSGKLRFSGLNENLSKNKKAFTLTGTLISGKLISESLNYNYSAQAEDGKSKRLYGTVRK